MIAFVLMGVAGAAGAAVSASVLVGLYPPFPSDLGGVPNLDRRARRVRIPVGADDAIDGWLLRGTRPAVVLVFHGFGRMHHRAWRYGAFLNRAGFHVLTVDFRSSRRFGRKPTTLGHFELGDAEAALAWLGREPELEGCRIGVFGESLGGAVALILAGRDPRVRSLVVDCPFASGMRALEDACERLAGVPRWPSAAILRSLTRAATGRDPGAIDALEATARLTERPVFFIHGMQDPRLSPEQTRDLWRAAGAKDPLWLIPNAGHNEGWLRERALYERRVSDFFARSLLDQGDGLPAGEL